MGRLIVALIFVSVLSGCLIEERYVLIEELGEGARSLGVDDYEVVGEVTGHGESWRALLVFGSASWPREGGEILAADKRGIGERSTLQIPILSPLLQYLFDPVSDSARRQAVFHAIRAAGEADALLFPRVEITKRSLGLPLIGSLFVYDEATAIVKAKAVRLRPKLASDADPQPRVH